MWLKRIIILLLFISIISCSEGFSEKEKQERKLSSDLNSIDTKLTELLRIDFTDTSIANRIVLECDDLNNLYSAIENICKNKIE